MKTSRFEKFLLCSLFLGFCYATFASEISDDEELFLWFSELSTEEAALLVEKDPEELEKDLESAKILFAQVELNTTETNIEQNETEFIKPESNTSEELDNE